MPSTMSVKGLGFRGTWVLHEPKRSVHWFRVLDLDIRVEDLVLSFPVPGYELYSKLQVSALISPTIGTLYSTLYEPFGGVKTTTQLIYEVQSFRIH